MIIEEKPGKNQDFDWWAERSKKLLEDQKETWPLLRNNYYNLSLIRTRIFEFDGFNVFVQFNPDRIKSTSANVSEEAINDRECFLCPNKLPKEQDGLQYKKDFIILSNPYPIFPEHFTISKKKHASQSIIGHFDDLLELSRNLGKYYTVFYNGPKCGASAPDHMHFQAATKLLMPIENEIGSLSAKFIASVFGNNKVKIRFIENYLRNCISLESHDKGELLYAFKIFFKAFKKISQPKEEPLMNIISIYKDNSWCIIIFPRLKHRPTQFFAEGNKQLLISPAAVDLGGIFIAPREEDFNKITANDIADIYRQVTVTKEFFEYLKKKIGEIYTRNTN